MATRSALQTYRLTNDTVLAGRRNNQAWFDPAIGVLPGRPGTLPQVFVRATLLIGAETGPQLYLKTSDLGKTWTHPLLSHSWFKTPLADDVFEEPRFGLFHHAMTNTLLAIGQTHFVQDEVGNRLDIYYKNERRYSHSGLESGIVISLWSPSRNDFEPWSRVQLPDDLSLGIYHNGQWHEDADGTILIPGYYCGPLSSGDGSRHTRVTVLRFRFDGLSLQYVEHGNLLCVETARGLGDPSMVFFRGRYLLTMRHDSCAYVATSEDGLHWDEPSPWCFDDGADLGSCRTPQKWLNHRNSLYLIYNRKSELSNGVYRSSAPLFMAEVNTESRRVLRNTERIVFPERGARMDSFSVARVAENESWIVTGEWLQGMFPHSKEGGRFWIDPRTTDEACPYNYVRFLGDLLLARMT